MMDRDQSGLQHLLERDQAGFRPLVERDEHPLRSVLERDEHPLRSVLEREPGSRTLHEQGLCINCGLPRVVPDIQPAVYPASGQISGLICRIPFIQPDIRCSIHKVVDIISNDNLFFLKNRENLKKEKEKIKSEGFNFFTFR